MDNIGRYTVERRLGVGGFATVWLGHDPVLDAPVAFKVLADNWAGDPDIVQRFLTEARLLRRINDPRVVRVHDHGLLANGVPYFVMDYADGGTLADLIKTGISTRVALDRAVEAAEAVQALHDYGIVHRDVKPSNLLIDKDALGRPRLVVADLGVAKPLAEAAGFPSKRLAKRMPSINARTCMRSAPSHTRCWPGGHPSTLRRAWFPSPPATHRSRRNR